MGTGLSHKGQDHHIMDKIIIGYCAGMSTGSSIRSVYGWVQGHQLDYGWVQGHQLDLYMYGYRVIN